MTELPLWFQILAYVAGYIAVLTIIGRVGGYLLFRWLRKRGYIQ